MLIVSGTRREKPSSGRRPPRSNSSAPSRGSPRPLLSFGRRDPSRVRTVTRARRAARRHARLPRPHVRADAHRGADRRPLEEYRRIDSADSRSGHRGRVHRLRSRDRSCITCCARARSCATTTKSARACSTTWRGATTSGPERNTSGSSARGRHEGLAQARRLLARQWTTYQAEKQDPDAVHRRASRTPFAAAGRVFRVNHKDLVAMHAAISPRSACSTRRPGPRGMGQRRTGRT